jgi:hypothetical protein
VNRPHDEIAEVGLVDEQLRLGDLGNPKLDRIFTDP